MVSMMTLELVTVTIPLDPRRFPMAGLVVAIVIVVLAFTVPT